MTVTAKNLPANLDVPQVTRKLFHDPKIGAIPVGKSINDNPHFTMFRDGVNVLKNDKEMRLLTSFIHSRRAISSY